VTPFKYILLAPLVFACLTFNLQADEIQFSAKDGGAVFADERMAPAGKKAPLIILFHQAGGDGRAEYAYSSTRLLAAGYSLLVVDQRSGGSRFGGTNRTVAARGNSTGYCEAYADMEAALSYAQSGGYAGPVFAFGSSYSAGLVVKLGAKNKGILSGVVAFSPASGGPMKNCSPNEYASTSKTPTMILRPSREMANPSAAAQFDLFKNAGHTMFVAENGVHGSSMLDPARTKADTEKTWAAVMAFLDKNSQ